MQVTLHHKEIEQNLKVDFPSVDADLFWTWKPWAAKARVLAEIAQKAALARLQEGNPKVILGTPLHPHAEPHPQAGPHRNR